MQRYATRPAGRGEGGSHGRPARPVAAVGAGVRRDVGRPERRPGPRRPGAAGGPPARPARPVVVEHGQWRPGAADDAAPVCAALAADLPGGDPWPVGSSRAPTAPGPSTAGGRPGPGGLIRDSRITAGVPTGPGRGGRCWTCWACAGAARGPVYGCSTATLGPRPGGWPLPRRWRSSAAGKHLRCRGSAAKSVRPTPGTFGELKASLRAARPSVACLEASDAGCHRSARGSVAAAGGGSR
jgi:hypothetical protein